MRKLIAATLAALTGAAATVVLVPGARIDGTTTTLASYDFSHVASIDGRDDGLTRVVLEVDEAFEVVSPVTAGQADQRASERRLGAQDLAAIAALEGAGYDPRLADGTAVTAAATPAAPAGDRLAGGAGEGSLRRVGTSVDLDVPGVVEARWVGASHLAVRGTFDEAALASLPGVRQVTTDTPLALATSDEHWDLLWGLHNIGQPIQGRLGLEGADLRWPGASAVATGRGVVVAIVDSGVELGHPDLAHAVWQNPGEICANGTDDDDNGYVDDCHGWDFVNDDATPADAGADNGHGTHVAGTIVAAPDNGIGIAGIAPDARIMSLKVQDGGSFPASRAAQAIVYAVDNGAQVINASWGSSPGQPASPAVAAAVSYAEANGVTVVAAAGNDGADIDLSPAYPAALPNANVISVAAMTNTDALAGFSNRGAANVDLAAPGEAIASTVPGGYGWASGTSMAAPHVTGVVALLVEHLGVSTPSVVRTHLLAGTRTTTSLVGQVATAGAADAATAVGIRASGISVEFTGLDGLADDVDQQLQFELNTTGLPTDVELVKRVTLGHLQGSQLVGVVGQPVLVDDGDGLVLEGVTTPGALLPLSTAVLSGTELARIEAEGWRSSMTFRLPAGTYALLVELVDANSLATWGSPQAGLFEVAGSEPAAPRPDPAPSQPVPAEPTPTLPVPGEPTPVQPVSPPSVGTPAPQTPAPTEGAEGGGPGREGPTDEGSEGDGSGDGSARGGDGRGGTPVPAPVGAPSAPQPTLTPPPPPQPQPTPAPMPMPAPTTAPAPRAPAPTPTSTPRPTADPTPGPLEGAVPPATASPTPPPTMSPTLPPTTSAPAPEQPPIAADPAVWPHQGPISGNAIVKVAYDGLPDDAVVWFGDSSAATHLRTPWMLLVRTPAHAAGLVDVRVTSASQPDRVFPDAYRFVPDRVVGRPPSVGQRPGPAPRPESSSPPVPTPDVSAPSLPGPGASSPPNREGPQAPTPPGAVVPPVTTAPVVTPPGAVTPPVDEAPVVAPPALPDAGLLRGTIGRPFLADNGLTVDPFERDEPLRHLPPSAFSGRLCTAPRCPAIVLGLRG